LPDGDVTVWDSLSICEYVAERFPEREVWPRDAATRAQARSVAAEMHSGFLALRTEMPMNCRARGRRVAPSDAAAQDIERIQSIWRTCRSAFGSTGPWLFGAFCAADAMFAPVVFRFSTYGVPGDATVQAYGETVLTHPAIARWAADAALEAEVLEPNEAGAV
jgi:glutathione S-transferase